MKARKVIKWMLIPALLLLGLVVVCYTTVSGYSKDRLYDTVEYIPYRRAALVLGTSPWDRNGDPNRFYNARIKACVYGAGEVFLEVLIGVDII